VGRKSAIRDDVGENRLGFALKGWMAADARLPASVRAEFEGLWTWSKLPAADRGRLVAAFERDPSLRPELELLLRRVGPEVRKRFVLAFADSLDRAARPAAAVMPALSHAVRVLCGTAAPAELEVFDRWRSCDGGTARRR
jgi:hypothetical protein